MDNKTDRRQALMGVLGVDDNGQQAELRWTASGIRWPCGEVARDHNGTEPLGGHGDIRWSALRSVRAERRLRMPVFLLGENAPVLKHTLEFEHCSNNVQQDSVAVLRSTRESDLKALRQVLAARGIPFEAGWVDEVEASWSHVDLGTDVDDSDAGLGPYRKLDRRVQESCEARVAAACSHSAQLANHASPLRRRWRALAVPFIMLSCFPLPLSAVLMWVKESALSAAWSLGAAWAIGLAGYFLWRSRRGFCAGRLILKGEFLYFWPKREPRRDMLRIPASAFRGLATTKNGQVWWFGRGAWLLLKPNDDSEQVVERLAAFVEGSGATEAHPRPQGRSAS